MTQEIKRAIQSAQERLETENMTQLQQEIYDYLKIELENIEKYKKQKSEADNQIRIHEENIKNLKTGNLEAIEKRRKALQQPQQFTWNVTADINPRFFYDDFIAGTVITIGDRKFIF